MFESRHIVSFSGGVCSFWAAKRVVDLYGPDNVTLLFADTMMEDEDLYRFNEEASAHLGIPITRIADGRTPWEVFHAVRIMGNSRIDPCSKLLKRELIWRWMRTNCVEMTSTMYLGLDWTEGHRLKQLQERKAQWRIDAPMQWEPLWDKNKMFCELGKLGIKVPRLYRLGFAHNNCGGFCVKAGQAAFVNLLRKLPERYAFHEAQEELFREKFGGHSILKKVINGETHSLTLRQLRESVEAGGEYDRHDWGGCGCSVEPINLQTPEVEKVKP